MMTRRARADDLVGDILSSALGEGGWDGLLGLESKLRQANERMAEDEREQAARERAIIADGFSEDPMRRHRLLVLLARKTVLRGPSVEERAAVTAEAYAIAKARREGENGIVLMLLSALADDAGIGDGNEETIDAD